MDFSTEELAVIALLLDADEEKEDQAHRKYWVHPAWKKRETEGEFQTLYKELRFKPVREPGKRIVSNDNFRARIWHGRPARTRPG